MGAFSDSINLNCQKILREVDKKCYQITWKLFTSVVLKTPVLTGGLINAWYPKIGSGFSSEHSYADNKRGSDSMARINALVNKNIFYGKDGVVTLTNNKDYAYRAEVLGWPQPEWSGQVKPYAMVRLSLVQVAAENR